MAKEPFDFEIKISEEQSAWVSGFYETEPRVCDYRAGRFGEQVLGQDIYFLQTDKNMVEIKEFDLFSGVANFGDIQSLTVEKINENLRNQMPYSYGPLI